MSNPGSSTLRNLLTRVRARVRLNVAMQAVADLVIAALGFLVAWQLWNATMPRGWAIGAVLPAVVIAALMVRAVSRVWTSDSLSSAAVYSDQHAELHDELTSAWWFSRHGRDSSWVDVHLQRAVETARGLDARRLVPARRPTRLGWIAGLAVALLALQLIPVPRVFENVVERLAAVMPGGEEPELIADLLDPDAEQDLLEEPPGEEELLMPTDEEGEEGEEVPGEEGQLQEQGEEPPEGAEQEPTDQEGEQTGEPAEQQEGQQADAENPEEQPGEGEGEPEPDPDASQQPGEGEQSEESDSMLPGGEEVFLQEGGEDVEQAEMSEEEMGHATREGGGEEELEEGELSTLEVQLQKEMLEVPEDLPPPDPEESEEEKEELVTKAERSFLEFENLPPTQKFAIQELLQAESIPWRYRQLVLDYFKAMRVRDNANRDGEKEEQR